MFKELRKLDRNSNKKIEPLEIPRTNAPIDDWVIDRFMDVAMKLDEIIEKLNKLSER